MIFKLNLDGYKIKDRIFVYYTLFFAILSLLTILGNIAYGLAFYFNYKWMGTFLVSAVLYYFSGKEGYRTLVQRAGIYLISFIILPICWLSSSGLVSPSITYSFLLLIMINYLMTGYERILTNIFFLLLNIGLIALYSLHPEYFNEMTPQEQMLDWFINIPLVFSFSALLLISFERAYEQERNRSEEAAILLKNRAQTDPLTGLYNRDHLQEIWNLLQDSHKRKSESLSLIMIDIDYFKKYNDSYGHNQGDTCLREFSRILESNAVRSRDFAYRIGGEEFLLILSNTDSDGARTVAARIQKDLEKAAIPHKESTVGNYLTVSTGITTSTEINDLTRLLEEADQALYQSKSRGRNRITLYREKRPVQVQT